MEIIRFDISSHLANFSIPTFNDLKLSYPHIHKCTILGVLGAIIGIEKDRASYIKINRKQTKENKIPVFYEELKDIDVAIIPSRESFPSVVTEITDTSGMFNKRGTYIEKLEMLINPRWTIYIKSDTNKHWDKIKDYILNNKCYFIPYLGRNSFPATIDNISLLNGEQVKDLDKIQKIDSFFIEKYVEHGEDEDEDIFIKTDSRIMPIGYNEELKQYNQEKMIYTNDKIDDVSNYTNIVKCNGKTLFFI